MDKTVRIIKDGTRCAGVVYNAGDDCKRSPKQADKLIVLGRASTINTRGTRKTADSDKARSDDPVGSDND